MDVDKMVVAFRVKFPNATDDQVEGYRQAVLAEIANPPKPEVLEPMPRIVAVVRAPPPPPVEIDIHPGILPPAPALKPTQDLREELRQILLGTYGFYLRLSPDTQHRIRTEDLSESELLALIHQAA